MVKKFKTCLEPVNICPRPQFIALWLFTQSTDKKGKLGSAEQLQQGWAPPGRAGGSPPLSSQASMHSRTWWVCRAPAGRMQMKFVGYICYLLSCLGLAAQENPCPRPSSSSHWSAQQGDGSTYGPGLSQGSLMWFAGWAGEDTGCEIQAGICLSSQGKDEDVCSSILQKQSLIQSQNHTSPLRDMAVWASKITSWQGPQRESELSPTVCWKGSFNVPQIKLLLHLSYTTVSSPCQTLVGSSSLR